jgi:nucleoside-diphosphate-sugar epimerase
MTAPAAAGQRYFGAGPFYWMSEIANDLRQGAPAGGRAPARLRPSELGGSNRRPFGPRHPQALFELCKKRAVSAEKARTQLGWAPRPYEETILATAESLRAEGLVKG